MSLHRPYAVEHDGCITAEVDLDPDVRRTLARIARAGYMIRMRREGIAINSRRIAEAQAELEAIEARQ